MTTKEFRLPDGNYTDSAALFSAEWDNAVKRFLDKLAAQQRRLDTLQADFTALQHAIVGDTARSAILELEDLKKDAARYRFLRINPEWLGWDADYRPDQVDDAVDTDMNDSYRITSVWRAVE